MDYLNSLKKSDIKDPAHKWIGTYNTRQMISSKFFRWLYKKKEGDREKWITRVYATNKAFKQKGKVTI